jgi:hypothetical protein
VCTFEEELDALFHGKYLEEADPDNTKCWLELMQDFPEYLSNLEDEDGNLMYENVRGYDGKPITDYSYNNECLLDQDIQYVHFMIGYRYDEDEYVLVQSHNGCDARGGLSKPRVFLLNDKLGIIGYARGSIHCSSKEFHPSALKMKELQESQQKIDGVETPEIDFEELHYWETDDANHYYRDGSCGYGAGLQLEKYPVKNLENDNTWEPGLLCVDAEHNGFCPICGAKLVSSF